MRSLAVIVLLASVSSSDAQDFTDTLVDELMDNLVQRTQKVQAFHDRDLDETTLAKAHPDMSHGIAVHTKPVLAKPSFTRPSVSVPQAVHAPVHTRNSKVPFPSSQVHSTRSSHVAHAWGLGTKAPPPALERNFPGAVPGPEYAERIRKLLDMQGFTPENTIFGTSICADEINSAPGTMIHSMNKHWGYMFPLGGIGGAPYAGKTGFGAFSAHVPDNGNVLVVYGPHVGITESGEIGKCLREGQSADSTACGACVAAYQQSLAGGVKADWAMDVEQTWLREAIAPHAERIKASENPMAELARVSYEQVEKKMLAISNTNFGTGYLALVGGIQINMPQGYPDYFLPLRFTVERRTPRPEDSITFSTPISPQESLDKAFPGALPGPVVHERLRKILQGYGFKPSNTIFGTSICSDEINTLKDNMIDKMVTYWGSNFPLGGIGGAPYAGKTGFGAFSAHVPDNGNVIVLFGPHVGISPSGEVGKCSRVGQSADSTACGACVAAYQQSLAGGMEADPMDLQQSWLRSKIAPFVDRIKDAGNPQAELARVAYEQVAEKMTAIANTNFGTGYLVLVGGIQVNMPQGQPDQFLPLSLTIQRGKGEPEDLLDLMKEF